MSVYSKDRARKSLIDTIAFRVVSQLATVLGYIVLVRAIPKEDFGVFNLFYAFIPVVSTVASFGLEQVLRRYQPEYLRAGNVTGAAWLLRTVTSMRFAANVVVVAGILLGWKFVAPLFQLAPYRAEFAVFSLLLLFHFQTTILQFSLSSHMLHRFGVGSMALTSIGKLVMYCLWWKFDTLTLDKAIMSDIVGYVIGYCALKYAHMKHCPSPADTSSYKPPPEERKRLIRYGLFNNFNDAGSLLLGTKTDNFYIAAFLDAVSVGVYSFYTRLTELMNNVLPVRLFENVVNPLFFAIKPADAPQRTPQYFSLLLNLNLLLQWPILAFSLVYHHDIVQVVFAGKFVEYSWLLPLTLVFATLNVVAVPVTLVAQYQEKAGIILLSKVFAIYNVLALLTLLPLAGIYGAAMASGSAQAIKNFFIWWHVRGLAVWTNVGPALLSVLVIWGGAVAACSVVHHMVPLGPLLQMMVGVLIFIVAGLIYLRSPALSASDREILGSVMRGKESVLLRRIGLLHAAPLSPATAASESK